mmetsp:Transcript_4312/g.9318  ORF Transcript_4312/g.9318 Transcript_4312/m.9318 type:complete len:237 (-) Transcript_4312:19-729(-)
MAQSHEAARSRRPPGRGGRPIDRSFDGQGRWENPVVAPSATRATAYSRSDTRASCGCGPLALPPSSSGGRRGRRASARVVRFRRRVCVCRASGAPPASPLGSPPTSPPASPLGSPPASPPASPPVPRVLNVLHDLHLGHVELVLGVQQALPPHRQHLGDEERVGLVAALLELLARVLAEDLVPRLALLVAPVELAREAQDLPVQVQRLLVLEGPLEQRRRHRGARCGGRLRGSRCR